MTRREGLSPRAFLNMSFRGPGAQEGIPRAFLNMSFRGPGAQAEKPICHSESRHRRDVGISVQSKALSIQSGIATGLAPLAMTRAGKSAHLNVSFRGLGAPAKRPWESQGNRK